MAIHPYLISNSMTGQFLNDVYQSLLDQLDEMKNNSGSCLACEY